ncbi:tetratricopeptide repeat protein [Robertmurraya siralis]|uniref:tetratricopeptide repeat protein n=1 Tax=Robertmurraya siralis TaxID=77777 RepID=UPI0010F8B383|nr:tetratricopeptide repeat protein [Robertmurraya siralis]
MNKKGRKRIKGNVIQFPDLEKRLLDKGLEQLQQKNFTEAVKWFEEAKSLAPKDGDVYVGLVLAYYEAGVFEKAKQLAEDMLKEGIGEYFQTVDLYLMILVQLHEYEKIMTTIEVLQDEKEIPFEKQEHFSKLLAFCKRMIENKVEQDERSQYADDENKNTNLLANKDPNQLVLAIAELAHKNVRQYITEVKQYLESEEGHPFLKTMLLNILQEQEYEKEIQVEKFGKVKLVVPSLLIPSTEMKQMKDVQKELFHLENEDPVLYQHIMSLIERHLYLLYPFEWSPVAPVLWAAAYHLTGLRFNGVDAHIEDIAAQYQVVIEEVERAYFFIQKLEKISYPII